VYECDKLKNTMFGTEGGSRGPTHNFQIEVPPRFNNRDLFFFFAGVYIVIHTHIEFVICIAELRYQI
jgi:hypothetical protein